MSVDMDRKRVQKQIDELRTTEANRRRVDELRLQKEGQEHAFEARVFNTVLYCFRCFGQY